jgi:hypothetical protein
MVNQLPVSDGVGMTAMRISINVTSPAQALIDAPPTIAVGGAPLPAPQSIAGYHARRAADMFCTGGRRNVYWCTGNGGARQIPTATP